MKFNNPTKYLSLLLIAGALIISGCSQNLLETESNLTPSGSTTVKISINTIGTQSQGLSTQSFIDGTVADITDATITVTQTDGPILVNDQALENHSGIWTAEFTLPINTELQFEVNSFNNEDRKIFSGTATKTLDEQTTQVSLTQAAIEDGTTNLIPQILQIARPSQISTTSSTVNISITVASAVSGNLTYEIIKDTQDTGTFAPQTGTIVIDSPSGSHTFDVGYLANNAGAFIHEVKLTNDQNNTAVVEFNTDVVVQEITASIDLLFYPVVTGLEVKSTASGLTFTAAVDYDNVANVAYEWAYTSDSPGEDTAVFNPNTMNNALLQGYNPAYSGKVTLTVRDSQDGSIYTTIEYVIGTNQFPDDIVIDPADIVLFPDPNLEAVIRAAINKPVGDIYKKDLLALLYLFSYESYIHNLKGLEYCINLASLGLLSQHIEDISPLANLTRLTELNLESNQITDISPLANLTNLTRLYLESNQITDISPLANLTNLTELHLNFNQITDISPLANLTNLTKLYLTLNQITDISPLANLTNLTKLYLNSNQITDISPLTNLNNLSALKVGVNPITNINPLANLTNLSSLQINSTLISDLTPLVNLTNLTSLYLFGSQITNIDSLANLTNLYTLDLSGNQITNIIPLANLTNLRLLVITRNGMDLRPGTPNLNVVEVLIANACTVSYEVGNTIQ